PAIDVLVNNAGGIGVLDDDAPLAEAERVWDEGVDANLKGPFLMSRAALPHLRRPGGRIVNLSSVAAFTGRGGPYAAAKAGVVGLTYSLALELGPLGITANAVAPGFIADTEFFGGGLSERGRQERLDKHPPGRRGAPPRRPPPPAPPGPPGGPATSTRRPPTSTAAGSPAADHPPHGP